ncbi:hypothetical protein CQW23_30201 [Capsicum baccatum]|uniref:Non-haem dioxygenase N-terminal domain-containing protein n=1 Tax=Capsicum baccatum TaxID=33114 RepID=A0A2G2VB64_CAPBA|nr:hypothetical protein CQW23_30201 [Capsicum baccatum]
MSHNVMLSLYLGIGDFMSARQVFDEIGERNIACWKAMINGYVKKGHGIDIYLMNEIKNITREYFHQSLTKKNKIKLSAETRYRGYQKIRENITKGIPDIPEAIDCYREVKHGMYGDLGAVMQGSNKWPSYPPSLKQAMKEYIDRCTCALLCRLHLSRIISEIVLALGRSADEMEGEIGGNPFWVLRIIGYPAASISNGHDRTQNDVGWLLYVLCDKGCSMFDSISEDLICREVPGWSEYLVDFGGLLVNFTSDGGCRTVLEACSFPSRVSDTGTSFRFHTRTSSNLNDNLPVNLILEIVDASCIWSEIYLETYIGLLEPNFDAAIEPLDVCLQKTGGTKNFEGAVYGKHLKIFKKPKKIFAYTAILATSFAENDFQKAKVVGVRVLTVKALKFGDIGNLEDSPLMIWLRTEDAFRPMQIIRKVEFLLYSLETTLFDLILIFDMKARPSEAQRNESK